MCVCVCLTVGALVEHQYESASRECGFGVLSHFHTYFTLFLFGCFDKKLPLTHLTSRLPLCCVFSHLSLGLLKPLVILNLCLHLMGKYAHWVLSCVCVSELCELLLNSLNVFPVKQIQGNYRPLPLPRQNFYQVQLDEIHAICIPSSPNLSVCVQGWTE